ncbi:ABC transporter permease [Neobacillus massiliamazoniensis]|uniref:Export ABC transporter permease protein n=1 Tax=Neobacillus massiliamazoniensis TaxID=1499688 RepID=A0A0U1NU28_9BACI|nr:ABC transporter permease [Neobacillus massiliamazoniensis]CRK81546.1 Export ABC transporter permease protein [Neobacillus massiliamazoniensis]
MQDILWLIKKTLSVTFRKKTNIILYFGIPLIGIILSFLIYGNIGQTTLKVGIVNQDRQTIANDTVEFIKHLNNVHVTQISEDTLNDHITSGEVDCAIVLNQGFSQSVLNGNPDHIELVSIKGAQITGFVKSYLYQYLDNITALSKAAGGDSQAFSKMVADYQQSHFKVSTQSLQDTSKNKDMTNQTVGFLLMIMLLSAGNFAEIIIKEKENRTYFRLLSTPINARKFVLSNIAVNMIVMLAQIIITLIFITNVFHIDMHVPVWQMGIILLLFALIAVGLSLMIVSFSRSSSSAGALQNLFFTPSCMLAGCFWPVEIMPKSLQKVADFMPQRWILDTISKLQQGSHFGSLYLNFLILLAFAGAFFLIATYKFGKNNSVRNFV